jgi:hypothetical protein
MAVAVTEMKTKIDAHKIIETCILWPHYLLQLKVEVVEPMVYLPTQKLVL